jgi:hypothetical protein
MRAIEKVDDSKWTGVDLSSLSHIRWSRHGDQLVPLLEYLLGKAPNVQSFELVNDPLRSFSMGPPASVVKALATCPSLRWIHWNDRLMQNVWSPDVSHGFKRLEKMTVVEDLGHQENMLLEVSFERDDHLADSTTLQNIDIPLCSVWWPSLSPPGLPFGCWIGVSIRRHRGVTSTPSQWIRSDSLRPSYTFSLVIADRGTSTRTLPPGKTTS